MAGVSELKITTSNKEEAPRDGSAAVVGERRIEIVVRADRALGRLGGFNVAEQVKILGRDHAFLDHGLEIDDPAPVGLVELSSEASPIATSPCPCAAHAVQSRADPSPGTKM
jgi:hypothetical protein